MCLVLTAAHSVPPNSTIKKVQPQIKNLHKAKISIRMRLGHELCPGGTTATQRLFIEFSDLLHMLTSGLYNYLPE